jgi:hypothetical protein
LLRNERVPKKRAKLSPDEVSTRIENTFCIHGYSKILDLTVNDRSLVSIKKHEHTQKKKIVYTMQINSIS